MSDTNLLKLLRRIVNQDCRAAGGAGKLIRQVRDALENPTLERVRTTRVEFEGEASGDGAFL